ncbi:MAG TPA: hypothetical protein VFX48_01560 [Saprospiraceae bacterium]|nr:hypothetical protein [Saprospiraceae bacterium]
MSCDRKVSAGPVLLWFLLCLNPFTNTPWAQSSWFQFSGYLKNMQWVFVPGSGNEILQSNLLHNRMNFKFEITPEINFRLEGRNRMFFGDQLKLVPDFTSTIDQYDGLLDLSRVWADQPGFVMHSVVDRMVLQYVGNRWDFRLGRQRIHWGIHNSWNPNDLFNNYNFLDFDYEERPGSDAVKLAHIFSDGSTLELAYKPGKKDSNQVGGILWKTNTRGYDFQALCGWFHRDLVLGGGWAGGIGKTGWKTEFSYFQPVNRAEISEKQLSISTEFDRTFSGDWYVALSALYQSRAPDLNLLQNPLYDSGLDAKSLFPAHFAVLGSASKALTGLLSASLTVLYGDRRNLLLLYPGISWNTADNFQIDLTGQSFFSKLLSSYGSVGHSLYLRARWSF